MSGIIGRKIGMTSVFDEKGDNIPCTVIEAGPNVVTQVNWPTSRCSSPTRAYLP